MRSNIERPDFGFGNPVGESGKEKARCRREERQGSRDTRKQAAREGRNYGDTKQSRRIPAEITDAVTKRDQGRDFGRPGHVCKKQGPPHHIIHFEDFLNGKAEGNPHTVDNLECPCAECHKMAHKMNIPSGISIKDFFRERFKE